MYWRLRGLHLHEKEKVINIMRAVVQRVSRASVTVNSEVTGKIAEGLLVLLGVGPEDTEEDAVYLANKVVHLRIFPDQEGKMNLSLADVAGSVLSISQFTLYGDCRKGRRPNFTAAAPPELGNQLYESFNDSIREKGIKVEAGKFGAIMDVELVNNGPVTLLLDSKKIF